MNEKVREYIETKKAEENKKYEKKKTDILIKAGLYEKTYAPVIGYGHSEGENKTVKFSLANKDIKVGDRIMLSKNGEKMEVIVDQIQSKNSPEYPFTEWDNTTAMTKYYKKTPLEVTNEEFEEIRKYSSILPIKHKSKTASALVICAFVVYILGLISGIVLGDTITHEFSWGLAICIWMTAFINGTLLMAISEIITALDELKRK